MQNLSSQTAESERVNTAWGRIENWYSTHMPDFELDAGAAAAEIQ